jgi:hypothetical protein
VAPAIGALAACPIPIPQLIRPTIQILQIISLHLAENLTPAHNPSSSNAIFSEASGIQFKLIQYLTATWFDSPILKLLVSHRFDAPFRPVPYTPGETYASIYRIAPQFS